MTQQFALIKLGSFSHANEFLADALRRQFSDYRMELVDVLKLAKGQRRIFLYNLPYITREYGRDLLLQRKSFSHCMLRTSYIFRALSTLAGRHLRQERYAFTLQTQAMFDASDNAPNHFVYTDHTALANRRYPALSPHEVAAALVSRPWIAQERAIYHHATLNFPMSRFVGQSMIEDYGCPPEKVVCAYAGGNVSDADIPLRAPVTAAGEAGDDAYRRKNILFVGVEWERKGGPELAAAFAQVLQKHPDASLTVVGCTPQLSLPNCRIVGKVPVHAVRPYYEQASLFCLPTRREPFGFVFIEAMLHQLPIVATRIGAVPDLVTDGENGYTVTPGDIDGLAATLSDLLAQPAHCRALGLAGRRRAQAEYSWDRVAQRLRSHILAALH
jgi:glycosyltransferase involved in cell wall biosynthesis